MLSFLVFKFYKRMKNQRFRKLLKPNTFRFVESVGALLKRGKRHWPYATCAFSSGGKSKSLLFFFKYCCGTPQSDRRLHFSEPGVRLLSVGSRNF